MLHSTTAATASSASSSLNTAAATGTPASSSRPTRSRGLSYLRSYTQNHLHRSEATPPWLTRSTSSPSASSIAAASTASPQPTQEPERLTAGTSAGAGARGGVGVITTGASTSVLPSTIQREGEHGWIPTIQGRSGLNRASLHPTSTSKESAVPEPSSSSSRTSSLSIMTRGRAATAALGPTASNNNTSTQRLAPALDVGANRSTRMEGSTPRATPEPPTKAELPTIRFIPHVEPRSSRPSLQFTALSRTLKEPGSIVRVGRYSERDNSQGDVVGFKSKVVSRRHCEFWCTEGQWYIKDVKSSSGTFLNHVRLSSPGAESRPYPVNDGDVVQLGIDFKGGEELIFRCVKIRVECNRGWQKSLNTFNTSAHKRLFKSTLLAKAKDSDAASVNSSECSICLNPVAPCQPLFVAPCSHVWHYKCIRNLIHGPNWPNFVCPNCRFVADLDADVEQPEDEEEETEDELEEFLDPQANGGGASSGPSEESAAHDHSDGQEQQGFAHPRRHAETDADISRILRETSLAPSSQAQGGRAIRMDHSGGGALSQAIGVALGEPARGERPRVKPHSLSQPIAIAQPRLGSRSPSDLHGARSATPTSHTPFALSAESGIDGGPMTPRNNVGPFVLDGSGGEDGIDNSLIGVAVGGSYEQEFRNQRSER